MDSKVFVFSLSLLQMHTGASKAVQKSSHTSRSVVAFGQTRLVNSFFLNSFGGASFAEVQLLFTMVIGVLNQAKKEKSMQIGSKGERLGCVFEIEVCTCVARIRST